MEDVYSNSNKQLDRYYSIMQYIHTYTYIHTRDVNEPAHAGSARLVRARHKNFNFWVNLRNFLKILFWLFSLEMLAGRYIPRDGTGRDGTKISSRGTGPNGTDKTLGGTKRDGQNFIKNTLKSDIYYKNQWKNI